jgi:hypothetical protein
MVINFTADGKVLPKIGDCVREMRDKLPDDIIGAVVLLKIDDYVRKMRDELPNDIIGAAAIAAARNLFKLNERSSKMRLDSATSKIFHHNVAMFFLQKRACPNI